MSNLINLDRDMFWLQEGNIGSGAPSSFAFAAAQTVRSDGILKEKHAYGEVLDVLAGTAGEFVAFGVHVQWVEGSGPVPFRVKAASNVEDTIWACGWATSVAVDKVSVSPAMFGAGKLCDEMVNVPEYSAFSNHSLMFYGIVPADAGNCNLGIQVQRLLGMPDQYSSGVR
jgi:hypothetical protein